MSDLERLLEVVLGMEPDDVAQALEASSPFASLLVDIDLALARAEPVKLQDQSRLLVPATPLVRFEPLNARLRSIRDSAAVLLGAGMPENFASAYATAARLYATGADTVAREPIINGLDTLRKVVETALAQELAQPAGLRHHDGFWSWEAGNGAPSPDQCAPRLIGRGRFCVWRT